MAARDHLAGSPLKADPRDLVERPIAKLGRLLQTAADEPVYDGAEGPAPSAGARGFDHVGDVGAAAGVNKGTGGIAVNV